MPLPHCRDSAWGRNPPFEKSVAKRKMRLPWPNSPRQTGGRGNTGVRRGGGGGVPPRGWPANVHAWLNFMTPSYIRTRKTPCRNAPALASLFCPTVA
jgi:hypothetical protein